MLQLTVIKPVGCSRLQTRIGIDYEETFAPVAIMTFDRVFVTFSSIKKWPIYQMDVKNAFLHGRLEKLVYEATC